MNRGEQITVARIVKVNHAGEYGAIRIYRSQIWVARRLYPDAVAFLEETLAHEIKHCTLFLDAMPSRGTRPCRVMSLWGNGGLVLGFLTALLGRQGFWICTAAVEATVHRHLEEQLLFLANRDQDLHALISAIQNEELAHLTHAQDHIVVHNTWSRLLKKTIALSTETVIWLSTWGDSARMAKELSASQIKAGVYGVPLYQGPMIVNVPPKSSDDPVFLTALNGLLAKIVDAYQPNEVNIVRIDRWFDHKWLGYSGKTRVAFNEYYWRDTALDAVWRKKLTFPPFNPNRVLEQTSFRKFENGYRRDADARSIHRSDRSHSARNLQNRVANFTRSGLFVWFSSDIEHLDQASVMSYAVEGDAIQSWFASLRKTEEVWKVHRVKGVDEADVQAWFPIGS